jgi:uncharacterized membrane protein YqaE (UPF0057 family)
MRYLFAILIPPIAVLMCGRPGTAMLNLILWVCGIFPGIIHAMSIVGQANGDRRNRELIRALTQNQRK